jgi:hypothetical protein
VADIVAICLEFTNVGFSAVISRFGTSAFRSGTAFRIDALNVGSQPNAGLELDSLNSLGRKNRVIPRAIGLQFVGCLAIFVSQILMLDCPMKGMRPYKCVSDVVNLTMTA